MGMVAAWLLHSARRRGTAVPGYPGTAVYYPGTAVYYPGTAVYYPGTSTSLLINNLVLLIFSIFSHALALAREVKYLQI